MRGKSVRFSGVSTRKMLYKNKNANVSVLGRETMYERTKSPATSYYLGSPSPTKTRTPTASKKRAAPHPPEQPYVNMYWYWDGKNVRRSRSRGMRMTQDDAIRMGELLIGIDAMVKEYETIAAKYKK